MGQRILGETTAWGVGATRVTMCRHYDKIHPLLPDQVVQSRADGSVTIHQDAKLYAAILEPGAEVAQEIGAGRHVWIQVVKGRLTVNGQTLETGDGAAIENPNRISFAGVERAEILVFDLA